MKCPYCLEEIINGAKKCKHCKSFINLSKTENKNQSWKNKKLLLSLFILTLIGVGTYNFFSYPSLNTMGNRIPEDFDLESAKSKAITPDRDDFFRYPEMFIGEALHFRGEVVQKVSDTQYRIRIYNEEKHFYNMLENIIFCDLLDSTFSRFLINDTVDFFAIGNNTITYQTVLGSTKTIPAVLVFDARISDKSSNNHPKKADGTITKESISIQKPSTLKNKYNNLKLFEPLPRRNKFLIEHDSYFTIRKDEPLNGFSIDKQLKYKNKYFNGSQVSGLNDSGWSPPVFLTTIPETPFMVGIKCEETYCYGFIINIDKWEIDDSLGSGLLKSFTYSKDKNYLVFPTYHGGNYGILSVEMTWPPKTKFSNLTELIWLPKEAEISFELQNAIWISNNELLLNLQFVQENFLIGGVKIDLSVDTGKFRVSDHKLIEIENTSP